MTAYLEAGYSPVSPEREVKEELQAYCFKCRKKVEAKNAERVTFKNGRPAMRGRCPVCGTKVFRIGKG